MSKAFRCDVCGSFYHNYPPWKILSFGNLYASHKPTKSYDVCQMCMKEMEKKIHDRE